MPIDNPNILGTSPESGAVTLALGACTPFSGRDYPHISKNGTDVSGHGWWDRGDCSGSLADVYNCIYEYYDDGFWYQKDCSSTERLSPGGGAGNRTNARRVCANFHLATWRNHVDVDVVGEWDTGENPMRQATINCQVF